MTAATVGLALFAVLIGLAYDQLWHDLTHASASMRWLREQVRDVARDLGAMRAPGAAPRAAA